ncbi:hypothetical protein Pelo_18864 [Pelomyxa schiedti]|nr:hypothetical protein Pelo_18864 [Pelomyxa schiedti]
MEPARKRSSKEEEDKTNGRSERPISPHLRTPTKRTRGLWECRVSPLVRDAVVHLNRLLHDAEEGNTRIEQLKADVQSKLNAYMNGLKAIDYIQAREYIPLPILLQKNGTITTGSHIMDLPLPVLAQIVGYLPPESVLAARAVCTQFRDTVSYGTIVIQTFD